MSRPAGAWFLPVALGGIAGLNLLSAATLGWGWMQVWASVTLLLAVLPTWQYLGDAGDHLPVFPLIAIVYGIYFGLGAFLPFDPYPKLADVSQASLDRAAFYGLLGLLGLNVGYQLLPSPRQTPDGPPALEAALGSPAFKGLLVVLGLIGIGANFFNFLALVPKAFGALLNLASEMTFLAIALYFHRQLTTGLEVWERLFLWALLIPAMAVTAFATSLIAPLMRLFALLLMVYIYSKRTFPLRFLLVGGLLLFPLMAFKLQYRKIEAASALGKFGSVTNIVDKANLFTKVVTESVIQGDSEALSAGMDSVAQRIDLLHSFANITDLCPRVVPYLRGETYANLPWKFVPRLLYPDKPVELSANDVGHQFGMLEEDDDTSTLNLPQLVELYVNFGPWGILPGMIVIGLIYRSLKNFLLFAGDGPVQSITILLLFTSLLQIESHFSGVFGSLVYSVVVFSFLGKLLQFSSRPSASPVAAG